MRWNGCHTAEMATRSTHRPSSSVKVVNGEYLLNNCLAYMFFFKGWLKPPDIEELYIELNRLEIW